MNGTPLKESSSLCRLNRQDDKRLRRNLSRHVEDKKKFKSSKDGISVYINNSKSGIIPMHRQELVKKKYKSKLSDNISTLK
jgi:hypothetical protein